MKRPHTKKAIKGMIKKYKAGIKKKGMEFYPKECPICVYRGYSESGLILKEICFKGVNFDGNCPAVVNKKTCFQQEFMDQIAFFGKMELAEERLKFWEKRLKELYP